MTSRLERHERIGKYRSRRRCIDDEQVAEVLADLDATGIVPMVEELVARSTGRHRHLSVRGLFAGMFLASTLGDGSVVLTQVTDILGFSLSDHMRDELGVYRYPDNDHGFEALYQVVRRLFKAIVTAVEPSPLPKNKRLGLDQVADLLAKADPAALARRRGLMLDLANKILGISLIDAHGLFAESWQGSSVVDATVIGTYSKGLSPDSPTTATDPDGSWYVRTAKHKDPLALHGLGPEPSTPAKRTKKATTGKGGPGKRSQPKERVKKKLYGYDLTLVVARDSESDGAPLPDGSADPYVVPTLILAMSVDKPSHRPAEVAIEALRRIDPRHPRGYLAGDRLYNDQKPDNFQLPIRAMGYQPVYDYAKDQLGVQAHFAGAELIEGNWYCPSMPDPLKNATKDLLTREIDKQTWINRIRERTTYLFMPKQRTDAEGRRRIMCPAEANRTQCLLKPYTLGRGIHLPLIAPEPSPAGPDKCCTQRTVTLPPEAGANLWQPLQYGTEEWQRVYFRLRNAIEGMNDFAKDPLREHIEPGGTRRIRGIAAQTILVAFQLAHANRRKLTSWADAIALHGERPRRRPTRRRETKALGAWTPEGYLTPT